MSISVTGSQLLDDLAITADLPVFNTATRPTRDQALRMLSSTICTGFRWIIGRSSSGVLA